MNNFKIVKKGYDIEQVDKYLKNLNSGFELANGECRVRISDLNCEIDKLKAEIAKYKERETLIEKTLSKAVEKADEIEYSSKVRFALEGERLNVLKDKWKENIYKYSKSIDPEWERKMFEYYDEMKKEIEDMFRLSFAIK